MFIFAIIFFLFLLLVLDGRNIRELPFAVDNLEYLTIIIPRAQMGSESIVYEAEGQMGYFTQRPREQEEGG